MPSSVSCWRRPRPSACDTASLSARRSSANGAGYILAGVSGGGTPLMTTGYEPGSVRPTEQSQESRMSFFRSPAAQALGLTIAFAGFAGAQQAKSCDVNESRPQQIGRATL